MSVLQARGLGAPARTGGGVMPPPDSMRRPQWQRFDAPVLAVLLAAFAALLTATGWVSRLDHAVFDAAQRWLPPARPHDVVIVAIDAASLDATGSWPWPRGTDADLLAAICREQPAAVGLDIAFTEPGDDPAGTRKLARAIADCGPVALPVLIENLRAGGQPQEALPAPPLSESAAALGRVGVVPGADGIVRGTWLWEGVGTPVWPLMAQSLLQLAGQPQRGATGPPPDAVHSANPYALVAGDPRLLRFLGPPGTVPRLSASALLAGQTQPNALRGRIVLLGATAVGLGDQYAVPFARPMPGVEVLANLVAGLRHDTLVQPLERSLSLVASALLAALPMLWLRRLAPLSGLLASGAWIAGVMTAAGLLTIWPGYWLPPGGVIVAGIAAYPLWSWRRLEAARRYLDWELQTLGGAPASSRAPTRRLSFEQRLITVQSAQLRLRDLQARRDEALAFISHDLRGPLASAVQRVEDGIADPRDRDRLQLQLRRALRLSQTFVSLSRAQSLDTARFTELELGGLLDQIADGLLDTARLEGVRLIRELPESPVWIRGDFEIVERMADNLLRNAIQHAPHGSDVTLQLASGPDWTEFAVCDDGPGPTPELRSRLFAPFARGDSDGRPRPGSTGLGLHFVQVASARLGGEVGVSPPDDGPTRFWVRLPRLPDSGRPAAS